MTNRKRNLHTVFVCEFFTFCNFFRKSFVLFMIGGNQLKRYLIIAMTREQFETYFRKYHSMVYRISFSQVKNHADAEDILQEVFVRLLCHEPEYESPEHEKAWMIRTALNLCRDLLKSKWQSTRVELEEIPEQEKSYFRLPGMEEDETLWAVMSLPEKFRNCLYLFYYEDYSIREIAVCLNMNENSVKANLKRGRERLKRILGDETI